MPQKQLDSEYECDRLVTRQQLMCLPACLPDTIALIAHRGLVSSEFCCKCDRTEYENSNITNDNLCYKIGSQNPSRLVLRTSVYSIAVNIINIILSYSNNYYSYICLLFLHPN